jgi:hypothetical protein
MAVPLSAHGNTAEEEGYSKAHHGRMYDIQMRSGCPSDLLTLWPMVRIRQVRYVRANLHIIAAINQPHIQWRERKGARDTAMWM